MCGSGVSIGMMVIFTKKIQNIQILQIWARALFVCCAVARGATTPSAAGWLSASSATPTAGGATSASACCLPFSSPEPAGKKPLNQMICWNKYTFIEDINMIKLEVQNKKW